MFGRKDNKILNFPRSHYQKTCWSFYYAKEFLSISIVGICKMIYFILSITKFKGLSIVIIATIVKDGVTTFQILISDNSVGDKSTNRSDKRTIYGGLRLTPKFGRSIFMSIIAIIVDIIDTIVKDGATTFQDIDSLVTIHGQNVALPKPRVVSAKRFAARTDEDPDHLWSSCRNFNEVKYELHLYKDDKSRVLFDKPIVWPVTYLVLTMNQMLTGPGKK